MDLDAPLERRATTWIPPSWTLIPPSGRNLRDGQSQRLFSGTHEYSIKQSSSWLAWLSCSIGCVSPYLPLIGYQLLCNAEDHGIVPHFLDARPPLHHKHSSLHFCGLAVAHLQSWGPIGFTVQDKKIPQNKSAISRIWGVQLGVCYDSESIPSLCFARKTFLGLKTG